MAMLPNYYYFVPKVKCTDGAAVVELEDHSHADVVEVVRCQECKYWRDKYVKQNDGRERQYRDDDNDGLMDGCVTLSVGVNMGAMCLYEKHRGWDVDKSVYRNADDYCSRGERRPCSYEQWWGIVDGFYPDGGREDGNA